MKPLPLSILIIVLWTFIVIYNNLPNSSQHLYNNKVNQSHQEQTFNNQTQITVENQPAYKLSDPFGNKN